MASVDEIMKRYNLTTSQGATRLIRAYLDRLNADGDHAIRRSTGWELDEVAVRRLDEIRGLTRSEAIQNLENAEIRSLTASVQTLQTALLRAQDATTRAQQQVLQAQTAVIHGKDQLLAMQERLATAEQRAAEQSAHAEMVQRDLERTTVALMRARRELEQLRGEQTRITRASLWQRIIGRW